MQENYLISITGRQKLDNETGEIEVTTLGSYVKKGNSRYIVYKEYDAEDKSSAKTSVLKVDGSSKVTLMRGGSESTHLILESGKRHLCPYDTGYGCMMVGIFTSKVNSELDDMGGKLEVSYTLDINSNLSSLNEILITVKEAKRKMSKLVFQATSELKTAIYDAFAKAIKNGDLPEGIVPEFSIEVPADRSHGDWATNAAMVSAKTFRLAPRKIAQVLTDHLMLNGTPFDRCEIAGPGFINFFLGRKFYGNVLKDIHQLGADYGHSEYGEKKKVMVEFVSANPTGPMHMGNARGGALGDCLAAVLDAAGYDVWREFYVNDAGNQIDKFGYSLEARYLQIFQGEDAVEFPEDGYHGEDIKDRASEFAAINGDKFVNVEPAERQKALVAYALPKNIEKMKSDLKKYRIEYDEWFLESLLHNDGELDETIQLLKDRNLTYEKDGALWYKATEFGSEKDEVLVRQNGNPTYFTADIAYHRNKFVKRGFERCIDVWGADHHGHVARMKGAMNAVGLDGSKLDVVLIQLVRLVKSGEVVRMSKRTGKAIQLADLLDEVPVDAARFYFNQREANSQMDFDLDLAVQQDSQNPVYYVQYARARICSILKALAAEGIFPRECTDAELALLTAPEEIELIRHLSAYTGEIVGAAQDYDPARITRYVITLATLFHKFYNACRVKGEDESLTAARLYLCGATSTVICNVLSMFKISAPETM